MEKVSFHHIRTWLARCIAVICSTWLSFCQHLPLFVEVEKEWVQFFLVQDALESVVANFRRVQCSVLRMDIIPDEGNADESGNPGGSHDRGDDHQILSDNIRETADEPIKNQVTPYSRRETFTVKESFAHCGTARFTSAGKLYYFCSIKNYRRIIHISNVPCAWLRLLSCWGECLTYRINEASTT